MAKSGNALSEDSVDNLEQCKRGKARKFVMLCRGASVVSLVVFRKGDYKKYVKEARDAGTGAVFFGVVDGSGSNLNFKLAKSDGFDKAPVKSTALKDFLETEGEFRARPLIEIVDTPQLALDEDDPLVQRFLALQGRAQQAADNSPANAGRIAELCQTIGGHLNGDDPSPAVGLLDQLETILNAVGEQAAAPQPTAGQDPMAAFLARVKQIKPKIDELAEAKSPLVPKLLQQLNVAADAARKQRFDDAGRLLDSIEKACAESPASPPADEQIKALTARIKSLVPLVAKIATLDPNAAESIRTGLAEAGKLGQTGQFGAAQDRLKTIEGQIKQALKTPAPQNEDTFLETWGPAKQKWLDAIETVDRQITAFQKALRESGDPDLASLADLGLNAVTGNLRTPFMAAVMDLERVRAEDRAGAIMKLLQLAPQFREQLQNETGIDIFASNPFGVQITIRETLGAALTTIERTLGA